MDAKQVCNILGINRAAYEVGNMIKALQIMSVLNSPEENERLAAAKWAARNWKKYQAECSARRNRKG